MRGRGKKEGERRRGKGGYNEGEGGENGGEQKKGRQLGLQ